MKELVFGVILAFFGSFFPAILFNIEKKNLVWAGFSGLVGWTIYTVVTQITGMPVIGTFFGAAFIGLYSEMMARILKTPASVFSISGIYPLVPGITAYLTIENIVTGNLATALNKGVETLAFAGAIAFGIMLVTALLQFSVKYNELLRGRE
jgi:uncharacterized membrane protein YjjB (DUF3815 family)